MNSSVEQSWERRLSPFEMFVRDVLFWMQCWYPLLLSSMAPPGLVFKDPESYGRAPKWISERYDSAKSFLDWWWASHDFDLMAPSGAVHTYSLSTHAWPALCIPYKNVSEEGIFALPYLRLLNFWPNSAVEMLF